MNDSAQIILDFTHTNNVTKIVAGKPLCPRWQEYLRGSLVDYLIHKSGDVDIHVGTGSDALSFLADKNPLKPHSPIYKYLLSFLLVVIATVVGLLVRGRISSINLILVYLLAVVIAEVYLGCAPDDFPASIRWL
jgi:two-component system, OmpR family, sensor histidine kinase KdpD